MFMSVIYDFILYPGDNFLIADIIMKKNFNYI